MQTPESPKSSKKPIPARSKSSTIQDIPLQKLIELKMDGKKSSTEKEKSSLVTSPSKHEFGSRPIK